VVVLERVHPDPEVAVGQEVEIAAGGVEARVQVLVEVVGDLELAALERVVEEDRVVAVLARQRVRDEAAVRRPGVVAHLPGELVVVEHVRLVDLRPLAGGEVHDVEREVLVAEQDLLPVGGPARVVELAVEVARDLRGLTGRHVADVELVLAGRVREVGDLFPAGREPRSVLTDARRAGEVPGQRVLVGEGNVVDVAACRECERLAVPRHVHGVDVVRRVDEAVLQAPIVGRDRQRQLARCATAGVQQVQVAAVHIDDALAIR
jgi:hypothetical protein